MEIHSSGDSAPMRSRYWNPFVIVALLLGLIQAWRSRFFMTFDGVSYLDMGDAYLRGDWHTAINGYWNPLYAWLQAIARFLFHPSPYWEYPLVHLVDYGIFAAAVFSFEYFLRGLLKEREDEFSIRLIAYAIFLWSSLELCRTFMVNPDMIIGASVYLAFGLLVRGSKASPVALGVVLATGYYAKAMMVPVALMILLVAWKLLPRRSVLIAGGTFALLCAPLVLALSLSTHHFTIGDTSRLNYAWYVNNVARRFWLGGPPQAGQPVHPVHVALDSPRVWEFDGVFPVTYPIWYDESYWYRGLHSWISPHLLKYAYKTNAHSLLKLLFYQGGGFLLGWLVCFLLQKDKKIRWKAVGGPTWLISVATLIFLCAVHLEPRHIASFVAVLFLIPSTMLSGRINKVLAVAVAAGGLICALIFSSVTTLQGEPMRPFQLTAQNEAWRVAEGMEALGFQPQEKFATVCCSGPQSVFWARLLRAHIVSHLDWDVNFWKLSQADQRRVLDALAASGAKVAVSEAPPPDPQEAAGWQRVGSSSFFVHPLALPAPASPRHSSRREVSALMLH